VGAIALMDTESYALRNSDIFRHYSREREHKWQKVSAISERRIISTSVECLRPYAS
jgi:hypothetical protein